MNGGRRSARWAVPVIAGAVLLGSVVYLLVLALHGERLITYGLPPVGQSVAIHDARPWLIAAAAAGGLTVAGWLFTGLRLGRARRDLVQEQAARAASERLAPQLEQCARERDQFHQQRDREQAARAELTQAWHRERTWNRRLREQIAGVQREQGPLGDHADARRRVLELTVELVEAEKGILLSDRGDGRLAVVGAVGFDNDPSDSVLAQRFASEVIERDTTIREDDEQRVDAAGQGAADAEVRNLLAIPIYLSDEFAGVIVCANRKGGFSALDNDVLIAVGDHAGAILANSRLQGDLRNAYLATVRALANAIELKDPALRGHSEIVSEYVLTVADRLGFAPERREALIFASLLHDVGKLGISERILLKPAELTPEERGVIQLHPRIGFQLVSQIPALHEIAPAILHHHERFDGDGYPARLSGQAIPLEARIITVADAFSAIISQRPYSAARSGEVACAELERCAGGQFDPDVVALFVQEVRRRPPGGIALPFAPRDPELEPSRAGGEFILGGGAFGITDSLTLLYSHRHFHETARAQALRAAAHQRPFAIIAVALSDLGQVNRESGFAVGDGLIQALAATVQRIASRWHGWGFRVSGATLALIAPGLDASAADGVLLDLLGELRGGPAVRAGATAWQLGEDSEAMVARALRAVMPT